MKINKKSIFAMIAAGILLVIVFYLPACISDNGLDEYKTAAKEEIQSYATDKGQGNDTEDHWTVIDDLVDKGKSDIDKSATESEVDSAVSETKEGIDGIDSDKNWPVSAEEWQSFSWHGEKADSVAQGYNRLNLGTVKYTWYVGYCDGWAYIYEGGEMCRMRPDGSSKQMLGIRYFHEAMIHDGWIYYTGGAFDMYTGMPVGPLNRCRVDGSENMAYENTVDTVTVSTGGLEGAPDPYTFSAGVYGFTGKGDWVYYLSGASIWDVSLYRINIDGTGKRKIAENCREFAIEGDYLLVTSYVGQSQYHTKITRYDLYGEEESVLKQAAGSTFSLLFEYDNYIYYWDYAGSLDISVIRRMTFDGGGDEMIAENASRFVTFTDGKIYYTNSVLREGSTWQRRTRLFSIPADGSEEAVMLDDDISGIEFIIGDSLFYETIEYPSNSSGLTTVRTLWRRSLTDGSVIEVYSTKGVEYCSGLFICNGELYIVVEPRTTA